MREAALRVHARDGKREVRTLAGDVLAVCATDAEAWGWIDRHTAEGQADTDRRHRIRQSGPFA